MLEYMRWMGLEPEDDFGDEFFVEIDDESAEMRARIEQRDLILAKIREQKWDELIRQLRPGWQEKL